MWARVRGGSSIESVLIREAELSIPSFLPSESLLCSSLCCSIFPYYSLCTKVALKSHDTR